MIERIEVFKITCPSCGNIELIEVGEIHEGDEYICPSCEYIVDILGLD